MEIYGAGLAGLLAGCFFQTAEIFEATEASTTGHTALLRFRSRAVGDAVGIEFRPVMVRKGIWFQNAFHQPSIQLANWYSSKVTGTLLDRSIWDVDSVERYIAPETLIDQLRERCAARIHWKSPLTTLPTEGPSISTIPMSTMVKLLKTPDPPTFSYQQIIVKRWRLPKADVYQTVYIPDPSTSLYRVSITGDLVIAEYMFREDDYHFWPAFGLSATAAKALPTTTQRFGKIAPIEEGWRKRFMFDLTTQHNIYSLGRFATWRNILLDDVLNDIVVIRRMMAGGAYDRNRQSFGGR